jgi:hypothetical protein
MVKSSFLYLSRRSASHERLCPARAHRTGRPWQRSGPSCGKPGILILESLQFSDLADVHAAILGFPSVDAGIADTALAAQVSDGDPSKVKPRRSGLTSFQSLQLTITSPDGSFQPSRMLRSMSELGSDAARRERAPFRSFEVGSSTPETCHFAGARFQSRCGCLDR